MVDLEKCKTLNDIAIILYGKKNYHNREKVKKYLADNGVDWKDWKKSKTPKKTCLNCGKDLSHGQTKFCSSSCSATYNNKERGKQHLKYCLNCGKVLSNKVNTYCNEKCHREKLSKDWLENWKNGHEDGIVGKYGISKRIRDYLLKKYDNKCQCCGWSRRNQYTNTIPLEIHHIDGDYTNNREENLQLLCPNCHSMTETYKNANKKGRKARKKYS